MGNKYPHPRDLRELGFHFGPAARDWIRDADITRLARDAATVTTANTTVPVEITAYIDPRVVEIMTAPRKARALFTERQSGGFATPYAKFGFSELTGATEPYSDKAKNRTSGVNFQWVGRDNHLIQTVIEYGDLEQEVTSEAKINLASQKQRAAANILDRDLNAIYMRGVAGKRVYGLLNAPNLNAALTPGATGSGGSVLWSAKDANAIYDDVLALFSALVSQSDGWVDENSRVKLAIAPALAVRLNEPNQYGKTALGMLRENFSNFAVVTVPEMAANGTNTMMLIAEEIQGNPVGELGYSVKVQAGRIVPDLSSYSQKWLAGTYGALIWYPFAIATMRGM